MMHGTMKLKFVGDVCDGRQAICMEEKLYTFDSSTLGEATLGSSS